MKKYFALFLLILLLCGCQKEEPRDTPSSLLEFPGLDWNAGMEEVCELFPGGETRAYENMGIQQYQVNGAELWGDTVTLVFEFRNGHINILSCLYEGEDADAIREKVRAAYGEPWKEYTWQEGRDRWRSEERMIDRLDEETALECRQELEELTEMPGISRFDQLYRLYEELCERYLVTLTFDEEAMRLDWNPFRYTMVAKYSEEKQSGKVPLETLMEMAEGGREVPSEDGRIQQIRIPCDEGELDGFREKLGPSSERFLAFDMPEGSVFWVSEEQVYSSFEKESQKEIYSRVAVYEDFSDLPYWMSAKMYRTPLVMLYWDGEAKEMVWDLTGQANLERAKEALG